MFSIESITGLPIVLAEISAGPGGLSALGMHVLWVIVFSMLGVVVLASCFWIMKKLMPFSVRKEIEEDQNTALAIVMGSVIVGMSIIIAAAIL